LLVGGALAVESEAGRRHHGHRPSTKHDNHFDLFVFTQHWPYTSCLDWEKKHGSCRNNMRPAWSVHGLWPTQFHKIAPGFCNDSYPFDVSTLEPVMDQMDAYWPDVEIRGTPNSLWEHEWTKHGTCAVMGKVEGLTDEQSYFSLGCRLAKESPVTEWLAAAGITPSMDNRYTTKEVWDAVVEGAGTRPHIDCEKINGEVYIKEVKVCYSKQLERVDCDGIKSSGEAAAMMGTCLRWPSFLYPSSAVPTKMLMGAFLLEAGAGGWGGILLVAGLIAGLALGLIGAVVTWRKTARRSSGYESL